jgi:hypothetical protein
VENVNAAEYAIRGVDQSLANNAEAFLTFVPSTAGRSAVAAIRRRGVSTCRTLFKPRSMLPRTLRAEFGVSFCVVVPSVLKKSKEYTIKGKDYHLTHSFSAS